MHTRCCVELYKQQSISIATNTNYEFDIPDSIADVPCLVEAFFRTNAPTNGNILVGNGIWTGTQFLKGRLQRVTDFNDVNDSVAAGYQPGFYIEYPGGMGRAIIIRNELDTNITDLFYSIRSLVTVTTDLNGTPGKQYG